MGVVRWTSAAVPVVVVALLGSATGAGPSLASDPPWQPPPCPATGLSPTASGTGAWFRLAPVLDGTGTLVGEALTTTTHGDGPRRLMLPPESFASGPSGGQLVVGDDDGARSRLRVIDVAHGCLRLEVEEPAVIRSALLAPDGASLWEHRVDRRTRSDLGVWRRALDGGESLPVLPGISADPEYGPTFATVLRDSADGHLVVASCGAVACRTRVLDQATKSVALFEHTGPPIGFTGGRLVAHEACDWWPCPIVAVEPGTGERQTLVGAAGDAELGGPADGSLVYQAADGSLVTRDVELRPDVESRAQTVLAHSRGLAPVRRGSVAEAGADLPPGSVLVAQSGRPDDPLSIWRLDPMNDVLIVAREVEP
jgi:hypothetical protein